MGSPVAVCLYCLDEEETDLEPYADVTKNIPGADRGTGCSYIDTNILGVDIVDWLEENEFGKRTGRSMNSGFCTYPEMDFYKGKRFWKYREVTQEVFGED